MVQGSRFKVQGKKLVVVIAISLICLILPQTAQAAEYYLDAVNGNDAYPGTSEQPWQTIPYTWSAPRGGNTIAEGDTVLFKNGDYGMFKEEAVSEATIRHRSNWVTYKAAPGHTPVFSLVYIYNAWNSHPEYPQGESYLILDGFRIVNRARMYYTSYVQIKNCEISCEVVADLEGYNAPYYASGSTAVPTVSVHNFTISDCNIYDACWGIGLDSSGNNIVISGNNIHRYGEDGIHFGGHNHNVLMENNYIHDCRKRSSGIALKGTINGTFQIGETVTQAGTDAEGVIYTVLATRIGVYELSEARFADPDSGGGIITGPNATIDPFTDQDPPHTDGISFQGADVNEVVFRGNRIIGTNTQGVKIENGLLGSMDDVLFENNLIYSSSQSLSITSITNLRLLNNTFMDDPSNDIQGARFSCSKGDTTITQMHNNIFDDFYQLGDDYPYTSRVISHGNNIFGDASTGGPAYPFVLDSTEEVVSDFNALFTNAAENDFTLIAGSAAIDVGNPTYAPGVSPPEHPYGVDIDGHNRDALPDAGCYEYGVTSILYGDVNEDAEISAFDAALAAHIAVDLEHAEIKNRAAAEVSGDAEVSAYDAALIAQKAVGSIEKFPVE